LTACNAAAALFPRGRVRFAIVALVTALPVACAAPRAPTNAFAGAWTTAEQHTIAFRDDTIVLNPPGEAPTPMSAQTCDGRFAFGYAKWSREVLLTTAVRQPELRHQLETQLVQPEYPIAAVNCGEGGTTYVLLDDRALLAIHHDRDIAGVERLTRP